MPHPFVPDHDVRDARIREWLRTGLWFLPMVWAFGAIAAALVLTAIDRSTGGDSPSWLVFGRGVDSARQVLAVIAGSTIAFTGTVFSITIVALQLASSQFSPRVLRTFLRDRSTQHCFGTFVATSLYSLMVLREVGAESVAAPVPGLAISGAFGLVVASVFAFVYLVHHVAQSVRAVSVIDLVAAETRASIRENFGGRPDPAAAITPPDGEPIAVVGLDRGPGALLGIDEDDLVALAEHHRCVLVLVPRVGDYVPSGAPLFEVHGDGAPPTRELLRHVGIGPERTFLQDTAFGMRQLVDVAERALSPAINDPTTAVQCVDRLHDLLRRLAVAPFHSGRFAGSDGALRLVVTPPTWSDLVDLAFTEIRQFGIGSIQIPRRLRAALLDLLTVAPPERRGVLDDHLGALDEAIDRHYAVAAEADLARRPDGQGIR